ncbi:MAG: hypothetical protein RMJ18_00585, partial [Candidatus Aenigmarchaeota archaeon]|nr:hypothetical protein [Candidatus Aenigmarchaeota archaeon]MDW8159907.1 hypothetical protein [Candidatus Aenigmarchaeota archaeon]
MVKNVRLLILIFLIAISLLSLSRIYFKKSWIEVSYINESAKCTELNVGDKLKFVNNIEIKTLDDYENVLRNVKIGDNVPIITDKGIASCVAIKNSDIGVRVRENHEKVLSYGIDIEGGVRVLLKAKGNFTQEDLQSVVKILTERLNTYGLSDVKVIPAAADLIQIEAAGLTEDDIRSFLIKQGYFEGKIVDSVEIKNNVGKIIFDGKPYEFVINDTHITINNSMYEISQGFYFDGIHYEILNLTKEHVTFAAKIFTSKDVENIFTDVERNYLIRYRDGYKFVFTIQISEEGAERFAKTTKGQPIYYIGGQSYIKPKLVLYLDGRQLSELSISNNIAGEKVRTPSIEGFRETFQEASLEKLRLQTILKSGSLPIQLNVERIETVTETEGKRLFNSIIYILIANLIVVFLVSFIRYRNLYVSFLILLVSISELILILGVASSQIIAAILISLALFSGIYYKDVKWDLSLLTIILCVLISGFVVIGKWVIDIPTIIGLISLIGNSGELIMLTDQIFLDRRRNIDESVKIGMKIVFNSSALLTFSMLPLAFLGLGS